MTTTQTGATRASNGGVDDAGILRVAEAVQAEGLEVRAVWAALVEQNRRLLAIIGAETPIAAFDLHTTWRAEKALYMEEVAALRAALDEAEARRDDALKAAQAAQAIIEAAAAFEEAEDECTAQHVMDPNDDAGAAEVYVRYRAAREALRAAVAAWREGRE